MAGEYLDSSHLPVALTMAPNVPQSAASEYSVGDYVLLGNDILMQWYSTLTNRQPVPLTPTIPTVTTAYAQQTTTLLLLGAIVVAVVLVSKKR